MSKEKLVPKLRFEEFKSCPDWEKYVIGDLMNVTSVKRIHQSDWKSSGVRFLRARDIVADYKKENMDEYLYISKERYEEYSRLSGKVQKGDLLVTGVGTIGVPYLVKDESPLYFKDGNIIWFKNNNQIEGNFLYNYFVGSRIQEYINNAAGIGTVGTYTITSGQKTPILLPNYSEQNKIGSFLKNIDELIQLQQSKVNKVKDIKSAYLSEMFPKEGEKYPKKRFEGFTEPWIEYSLERLGDIVGGNSWKSNEYDKEGSHLIITIANVSGDYSVDINEGNKITPNNNRYVLSEGDILISMTGNVGRVSRMPEVKAVLNQRVGKLVINSGIDKEFIFTILQNKKFERSMILQGQGAAQLNISRTDILDYRFKIPEYNEQKKIGQLFKNINDQISVEEEKLMKLEKLKQAYLNDMFV